MSITNRDPALRLALHSMLQDLTYPQARKAAPWVEAQLQERAWPPAHREGLVRLVLRWARAQEAGVAAAVCAALGEEGVP